jgi:hypothetical protein
LPIVAHLLVALVSPAHGERSNLGQHVFAEAAHVGDHRIGRVPPKVKSTAITPSSRNARRSEDDRGIVAGA